MSFAERFRPRMKLALWGQLALLTFSVVIWATEKRPDIFGPRMLGFLGALVVAATGAVVTGGIAGSIRDNRPADVVLGIVGAWVIAPVYWGIALWFSTESHCIQDCPNAFGDHVAVAIGLQLGFLLHPVTAAHQDGLRLRHRQGIAR